MPQVTMRAGRPNVVELDDREVLDLWRLAGAVADDVRGVDRRTLVHRMARRSSQRHELRAFLDLPRLRRIDPARLAVFLRAADIDGPAFDDIGELVWPIAGTGPLDDADDVLAAYRLSHAIVTEADTRSHDRLLAGTRAAAGRSTAAFDRWRALALFATQRRRRPATLTRLAEALEAPGAEHRWAQAGPNAVAPPT
ncbi:MAG: hypothetical protein S0880_07410 [Actinomycetota bacterium]|nr:hypothetical protein [Actinomycetota bacterium]